MARYNGMLAAVVCVTLKLPSSLFHSFTGILLFVFGKIFPATTVLALNHEVRLPETPPGVCAFTFPIANNNKIQATAT